ncbi:hypothetical protein ELI45_03635 [Rhizobium ruizarguesonis]|nr:hypothetical protein ELI45_03635 [Rhizobium ruizarguesonis]
MRGSKGHPPLSCRTSPPQGGRSAGRNVSTFMTALRKRSLVWGSPNHLPISPPVGEMPGRAEGGTTPALRGDTACSELRCGAAA